MRAPHQARVDEIAHGILHRDFAREVEPRREAFFPSVADFQKVRRAEFIADFADQDDDIALLLEELRRDMSFVA